MADSDDNVPTFPDTISFGDLKKTHAEYDADKIQKHFDLYEGGDSFRANIERYLVKTQDESFSGAEIEAMYFAQFNPKAESHGGKGEWNNQLQIEWNSVKGNIGKQYSARKARAWYPPIVAGLIDFMIAAVFQNPPSLVPGDPNVKEKPKEKTSLPIGGGASGIPPPAVIPADSNEDDETPAVLIGEAISMDEISTPQDYWHEINKNCDGNGKSLRELMRDALLEIILNKRAYLSIGYDPTTENQTFDRMKAAGGLDGRLHLLTAKAVDDWQYDDHGALIWIRHHNYSCVRSQPWLQPDTERHCWYYVTANAIYEYELKYPKGKAPADEFPVSANITTFDTGFPIIQIPCSVWVMERLADIALGLFNRQASLTWHLDKAAFAVLVLATKRALKTIVDSTLGAVRLDPQDTAQFVSPDMAIPDALMKDIERWKDELHSAVQAMVLQAASKDSGDRASGVAKQRDFGALSTLLTPFAAALKESLRTAARKILTVRKDTNVMLMVYGLNNFDVQSVEMKLANVLAFCGLPNAPKTAKKFAIADAALAMMTNAPTEAREQAVKEIQESTMDAVVQPAGQPGAFGKPASVGSGQTPDNKSGNPIGGKAA